MKPINKSTSKKYLFEVLSTLRKDEILEVIEYFNDLPESKFPYQLKTYGTKEYLISGLRSVKSITQKLLYTAINRTLKGTGGLTREEFEYFWKTGMDKSSREVALRYVEAHLTQGLSLKLMASYFIKERKIASHFVMVCRAYIKYRVTTP